MSARSSSSVQRRPFANSARTVIRFCVSVPVLSTHSTEVCPSASIALMRRASMPSSAMRRAPSAMNTVITTGISSGKMPIASVIPASTPGSHSPERQR
ncbi:Uncharacterised protein [Burkholderia pseudomallei]|nr:aTPase, P-type (Transporting), HAD super, subfamily IC [Burkholderia pseudomallei]KGD43564.1 putative cation-transporting ATPase [Burkholderia pseudomallei]KGD59581.1 putative cation-transporting ATPase [Burkholderia pseudomallei]CAJ7144488.1 Uncharacterised protein [Burkholderia pseudomallei]